MRRHLVVFLRAPQVGAVKSRLARDIGAVAAWKFYRDQSNSLLRRVQDDRRWQTWLAVTPYRFVDSSVWSADLPRLDQGGGDLGLRMARPFLVVPPGPVVLVGSDIPDADHRHISAAFGALDRAEVVLGPARDGGFWLIGMRRRPRPARHLVQMMFAGVRWSTPHACKDVADNLDGRATLAQVETLQDIDTGSDLTHWRQRQR